MTKHNPPDPCYFRFALVLHRGDADGPRVEEVPFGSIPRVVEFVLDQLDGNDALVGVIGFELVGTTFRAWSATSEFEDELDRTAWVRHGAGRVVVPCAAEFLHRNGIISIEEEAELLDGRTRGEIEVERAIDREIDRRLGK